MNYTKELEYERGVESVEKSTSLSVIVPNPATLDTRIEARYLLEDGQLHPFWAGRQGRPQEKLRVREVSHIPPDRQYNPAVNSCVRFTDPEGKTIELAYSTKIATNTLGGNGWNSANDQMVTQVALESGLGSCDPIPRIKVSQELLEPLYPDVAHSRSLGIQIIGGPMPLRRNTIVKPIDRNGLPSDKFNSMLLSEMVPHTPMSEVALLPGSLYIGGLDENDWNRLLQRLIQHKGATLYSPSSADFNFMDSGALSVQTVGNVLAVATVVTLNKDEAHRLARFLGIDERDPTDLAKRFCSRLGVKNMVITADRHPVVYASAEGEHETLDPCNGRSLDQLVWTWGEDANVASDATGCGDALAAGILAGLNHGLTMIQSLKIGLFNAGTVFCSSHSNLGRIVIESYTDALSRYIANNFQFLY